MIAVSSVICISLPDNCDINGTGSTKELWVRFMSKYTGQVQSGIRYVEFRNVDRQEPRVLKSFEEKECEYLLYARSKCEKTKAKGN